MRSYVETIRLEDRLRDHPAYFDAARLAIEVSFRYRECFVSIFIFIDEDIYPACKKLFLCLGKLI